MLTPKTYPSKLDDIPFEVKQSKGMHLLITFSFFLLASISIYNLALNDQLHNSFLYWTLSILFSVAGVYFLTNVFKPKVIIRVDNIGIWVNNHGLLAWEDINYFYTKSFYNKGIYNVYLYLQPLCSTKEIKVDLTFTDNPNDKTIRRYIDIFKGENIITDLGRD